MATQPGQAHECSHRLAELEATMSALESSVHEFAEEIRTRRLVVVDDKDQPRIVAEVFAGVAELRLELSAADDDPGPEVLLFAVASTHPGPIELGPAVGLQLRAHGRAIFELDAWPGSDGVWRPHLHMDGC